MTPEPDNPNSQHADGRKPLTVRRVRRKLWRVFLIAVIVALIGLFVLTRTGVARALVLPRISVATGLDIDARSVIIAADLTIIMRDVHIRMPGVPGEAGEILAVDRLVAEIDWARLPSPEALLEIELEQPRLRVSQDGVTGTVNVTALPFFSGVGGGGAIGIPTVVVRNGMLELGEHNPPPTGSAVEAGSASGAAPSDGYITLAEIPFSGVLAPQPGDAPGRSNFILHRGLGETGFELHGVLDESGATIFFGGLVLDDWPVESIPSRVRDLWTDLALRGRIAPSRITLSATGAFRIDGTLDGVALTLPFLTPLDPRAGVGPLPRLTDVNGAFVVTENSISADLTGIVDKLHQRVVLDLWGFDPASSPFTARLTTEPLRLERDLQLLNFVPEVVNDRLEMFGRPEADLMATVWFARKEPPPGARVRLTDSFKAPSALAYNPEAVEPDEARFYGELSIENGTASYRGFPYRFDGMSGTFAFTGKTLWIESIRGVSPSGARLSGSGQIGPLGPDAEVFLGLVVAEIAIDETLTAAMNEERRGLVEALFSQREYDELVEAGLVRTPEHAGEIQGRIDAIDAERQAWTGGGIGGAELERLSGERSELEAELDRVPMFALGGALDATISIHRRLGSESIWTRDITLTLPSGRPAGEPAPSDDRAGDAAPVTLGLLSEHFPVPTIARGVRLHITDGRTVFDVFEGSTIAGGDVVIEAELDTSGDDAARLPSVSISARGVPIDETLIRAISGPDVAEPGEGPIRMAGLLRRLDPTGLVDSEATITPEGDGIGYDITSTLRDVNARVGEADISIAGVGGTADVTPSRVMVDLAGTLVGPTGATVPDARISATMTLPEGASWTDPAEGPAPSIDALAVLDDADLAVPLERVVALIDPTTAERLEGLRDEYRVSGRLRLEASVRGELSPGFIDDAELAVRVSDVQRIGLDLGGMRLEGAGATGSARVTPGPGSRIDFDDFRIDLHADGVPSGTLRIDDTIPYGDSPPRPWALALERGRFESPLSRWMIASGGSLAFADWVAGYDPRGEFDLDALRRADGRFEGSLRPRTITLATPRGEAVFTKAGGSVAFAPEGGRLEGVTAEGEARRLSAGGTWTPAGGTTSVDLELSASAGAFDDPIIGLAPGVIGDVLDVLGVEGRGGVDIPELALTLDAGPGGVGRFTGTGTVIVSGASLHVGAPVTELDGTIGFGVNRDSPDAPPTYALTLDAQRWRLLGLRMTGGHARLLRGREPGTILIPEITATAHGGRFTGAARLVARPDGGRDYLADLQLAEVRLAPLLEDVKIDDTTLAEGIREDVARCIAEPGLEIWDQSTDRSRGLVNASFSLAGVLGQDESRRGRGRVIASGGPVLQLPLLTPLLEVTNLRLPVGDELGLALASVYLDSDRLIFEDIAVFSKQVELLGYGEMSWPDAELDLRFRSRGASRIPFLSGVVESVRDELLGVRLTGPLTRPRVSTETLAETRRVVGSLLWGADDSSQRQLVEISRDAGQARTRIRKAGEILDRVGGGQAAPVSPQRKDAP